MSESWQSRFDWCVLRLVVFLYITARKSLIVTNSTNRFYTQNADSLFKSYRSIDVKVVHSAWVDYLPTTTGKALDIGAGSGRDSEWLSSLGWEVTAIEPTRELLVLAQQHSNKKINWLNDKLPELEDVHQLDLVFQLILVSAVWMHLNQMEQQAAIKTVSKLLQKDGVLVVTVRQGNDKENRGFYNVDISQTIERANDVALTLIHQSINKDLQNRDGVSWVTLVWRKN